MKSLMLLWKTLAIELADVVCTSATSDCKTVTGRVKHEGLSFLTITLPSYGKDFERSLDQGKVTRDLFTSFKWRAGLPLFLGGFLERVFDRSGGVLLDTPDIESIRAIRQLTLMFGKVRLPCTPAREKNAMLEYIQCEKEVDAHARSLSASNIADFNRVASLLFRRAFTEVDRKVYYGCVVPKHGPGATADSLRGNAKWRQRTWTDRLEAYFPAREMLCPNWSFLDQYDDIHHLEPGAERPAKVISVPKTLKTPRIIAMEPTAMQYAQQGLLQPILEALGNENFLSAMLGFQDQEPNQLMAADGSLHCELATLDLSEASDRVSNRLVREMMGNWPHLSGAVQSCRSLKARVPSYGTLPLTKFASMGSALCFPIEAMVFLTMVFVGIERELRTPLTRKLVKEFMGKVRIYGDDIIIPVDYVQPVMDSLALFGAKVNTRKSFWTGKFRESCGKEYYSGEDISIVRVRSMFPTKREHAQEIISIVSLRNQLYNAGYWRTVGWLDDYIKGVIKHFPIVAPTSPVLGRHSFLGYQTDRVGGRYQRPLVKGYVVSSVIPSDPLDGPDALNKWLVYKAREGEIPFEPLSPDHLERAGRPRSVRIRSGWHPPF
jgi:hypothetical protein